MTQDKTNINKYLLIFTAVMVALITFKVTYYFADKKLEKVNIENRKLKISKDKLKKVANGHYTKLVADTLTKNQLRKEVEDLKIKVKDGVIVEKIVLVPVEVEKEVDSLKITKDSLTIIDYYPKKNDWFTRYEAIVSFKDSTSLGKFTFGELPISLVISQQEDGTFKSDLKAPDFITISKLNVLALPLTPKKEDNFGFLAGGKVNRNFENGNLGYEIIGGFRFKKVNVITSVNSNQEFGIGTLIEF